MRALQKKLTVLILTALLGENARAAELRDPFDQAQAIGRAIADSIVQIKTSPETNEARALPLAGLAALDGAAIANAVTNAPIFTPLTVVRTLTAQEAMLDPEANSVGTRRDKQHKRRCHRSIC